MNQFFFFATMNPNAIRQSGIEQLSEANFEKMKEQIRIVLGYANLDCLKRTQLHQQSLLLKALTNKGFL